MIDFGPLQDLLNDETITEIMVNSWDRIFIERDGLLTLATKKFIDRRHYSEMISNLLFAEKKILSEASHFDGFYQNQFRYNIVMPPMSPLGPLLTIRKFLKRNFELSELIQQNTLSDKAAYFLQMLVESRMNLLVSGGTGSGKTSLLNCLASLIPGQQRVVTIEDIPELSIQHPNWVQMLSHRSQPQISTRDCLVNALRMRPDRIIVGECRRDETFEMLQAMNTGHEGSMTSIHANNAIEAFSRLESLILIAGIELPPKSLRKLISQSVHYVIQLQRGINGQRNIVEILEVTGLENETVTRASLFLQDSGVLKPTGIMPSRIKTIESSTKAFPLGFFDPKTSFHFPNSKAVA